MQRSKETVPAGLWAARLRVPPFALGVILALCGLPRLSGQNAPQQAPSQPQGARPAPQQGGMSTGAARPAVKDAQMRPITAGGFVDGAPVVFVDATRAAGLDKFRHRMG